MHPLLTLRDIHKAYAGGPAVLNGIDLEVAQGEILCLLGPSGCGKTTLLRIIAGLESIDRGDITFDRAGLASVPVHKRNFGFMFQDYALFPHRSVGQNIAFGLRMEQRTRAEIAARVYEMMALINLPAHYQDRSIFELSGGERQRVALARSLAPSPRLLMLDEPLGNLDRGLRESLALELRAILKQIEMTALYVTHDQEEAYALADRIAVMDRGTLQQVDTPQAIYAAPNSAFVAQFLGLGNLLAVTVTPSTDQIEGPLGSIPLQTIAAFRPRAGGHLLLIRPQALIQDEGPGVTVHATLVAKQFRGDHYRLTVAVGEEQASAVDLLLTCPAFGEVRNQACVAEIGAPVTLKLDPAQMQLLPDQA